MSVDGRRVHFSVAGSGDRVVLWYSGSVQQTSAPLVGRLVEAGCTIVSVDMPGRGLSDELGAQLSVDDLSTQLLGFADAIGVTHCVVYGRTFGGAVAAAFARAHPERVSRLILDEPFLVDDGDRDQFLKHTAPIPIELDGSHLWKHWSTVFARNVFDPWFSPSQTNRLLKDMPPPTELAADVLDRLTARPDHSVTERPCLEYDLRAELHSLEVPTTIVFRATRQLERLRGTQPLPDFVEAAVHDDASAVEHVVRRVVESAAAGLAPPIEAGGGAGSGPSGEIGHSYAATRFGQIFVRSTGGRGARPLVLLHPSPTSGAMLEEFMTALAPSRRVYALDTLGNGDSDKPDVERDTQFARPGIEDYAPVVAAAVDALGIDEFDLYGNHTGALIALETAILLPERVRHLVMEGVPMYEGAVAKERLERYFVDVEPRLDGTQLMAAWSTMLGQALWKPWYRQDAAHAYEVPPPTPAQVQNMVTDLLKSGPVYELAYRAVFEYPTAERLALVPVPSLVCAQESDTLSEASDRAVALLPDGRGCVLPVRANEGRRFFSIFSPDASTADVIIPFLDDAGDHRRR